VHDVDFGSPEPHEEAHGVGKLALERFAMEVRSGVVNARPHGVANVNGSRIGVARRKGQLPHGSIESEHVRAKVRDVADNGKSRWA